MTHLWDREVDLLVAGSGAAGLSAAITAADAGLDVLVVEGTDRWGGTTMKSGGGLWMPTNPLMAKHRIADSRAEALQYMQESIGDDAGAASSTARREAFVDAVNPVFDLLARHGVKWTAAPEYPDYYPDRPGGKVGRAIEVQPFDAKRLGEWAQHSRKDEGLPAPVKTDDMWLLVRAWSTPSGFIRGARFTFRLLGGLLTGKRLYGMGSALTMSLMEIVRKQGTDVLLSSPVTDVVVEDGRVVGALVSTPTGVLRVRTRRGLMLAAGGFARNAEWRERYHGVSGHSSAPAGDLGTGIEVGMRAGGDLALMDDAWWGAAIPLPDATGMFILNERSMPFSIVVDQSGQRYLNESESYIDFGHHLLERNETVAANPSWLIMDARFRRRYLTPGLLMNPKELRETGCVHTAKTLDELAAAIGVDAAGLRATVERFNGFARTGVDADFGRGRTVYDNYYGDPRVKPNPNLGPIEKGPFTAIKIVPGDLGTKGGLLTDEHARVLDEQGAPIPGLYAAGNTTASVMGRTYPGPGSTIGPAVVFGYLGARHAAEASALTPEDPTTSVHETAN
ncbi:FAD-dependent oxidoreductase [Agromyces sp. MMS24-K17]|uniref:FAD-dependent oxidoreductase n=1 Tax=Agromyces sp. MMS24-K17 TaxID=3372850 RepID=UPI003754EDCC